MSFIKFKDKDGTVSYQIYDHKQKKFVEAKIDESYRPPVAPMIMLRTQINDFHPVTGEFVTDSKKFQEINKRVGAEERDATRGVNNPVMQQAEEKDYEEAVVEAREMIKSGNAPLGEYEREMIKRANLIKDNVE